jgi:energy-coupling factor transport system permease protein
VREAGAIHAWAWLVWLGAIVTVTARTRNPWYLAMTLLWVVVTELVAKRQPLLGRAAPLWSPLRFGLFVIPIAALFNALTVHVGQHEIGRLPLHWPLLGGPITLEAMLFGALNGLALTTLFGAFAVVNRMLPLRAIIHLIPRTYYPVAVVAAIALTFVPVTLQQWQQIREAQAIRGHHLRGARSWLALWLPLLTGGMERALQLAEAMTARGFAGGAVTHTLTQQFALSGGLVAVLGGLLLYTVWGQGWLGALIMVVGGMSVLWVLRAAGRQHPHTRYRPMEWQRHDWIVAGGALVTALAFLLPIPGSATLYYSPYPVLTTPPLALTLGVALWGLLAPAALWLAQSPENLTQSRRVTEDD